MKHAYSKNMARLITRNKRRFLEILAIVALGVAFFAGLRAASPDMKMTVEDYFNQCNAGDIRILSTLGITEEDVEAVAAIPGVSAVSPEYSLKGTVNVNHESLALSFESLDMDKIDDPDTINKPQLTEGRYPQKPGECLADRQLMIKNGLRLGDVVTILDKEDNDAATSLKVKEYTITGFVRSTKYISLTRSEVPGSSNDVKGYLLVDTDDFDMEVATALYLKVENPQHDARYEQSYEDKLDPLVAQIEALGTVQAPLRYEEVVGKANEELADAKAELEDAKKELADAETQLDDAKAELDEGRETLRQKEREYQSQIVDARGQLNDAKAELDETYLKLNAGRREYEDGLDEYNGNREKLDALADGIGRYQQGIAQLEAVIADNEEKMAALDPNSGAYLQLAQTNQTLRQEKDIQQQNLDALQAQYDTLKPLLDEGKTTLDQTKAELDAGFAAYQQGYDAYSRSEAAYQSAKEEGRAALDEAWAQLEANQAEYEEARATFEAEKPEAEEKIADGEQELADARKQIEDISSPKWYVTPVYEESGFSGYLQDADRVAALGLTFPLIFFLVAALVSLTNMTRMVESDRTEIGVLGALGYSGARISMKYLIFTVSASVIGIAIGLVAGLKFLPWVIFDAYGILYDLPPIHTPISMKNSLLGASAALLCAILPTAAICKAELSHMPASLMRPKAPKQGKRIFLERVTPLWQRFTFSQKVAARNIFRYKKRLLMSVIGIAGCTALIMTGFGLRDCINEMVPVQYGQLQHYDMIAYFHDDFSREQRAAFETKAAGMAQVDTLMFLSQQNVDLQKGDSANHKKESAVLIVPEDMNEFTRFVNLRERIGGRPLSLNDEGVVVTEKIAAMVGVKRGDVLNIQTEDGEEHPLKVLGVCENYVYHYVYMTPTLYENLYGKPATISVAYGAMTDSGKTAEQYLVDHLENLEGVTTISFTANLKDSFADMTKALDIVVVVLIVSAAALAFVVLFSLTNINIDERIRELATLKVLGFTDFETAMHIYRENVVITVMGVILGLGLGAGLVLYILSTVEMDMIMFTRTITVWTCLISAAFTFLFALAVNLIMKRTIRRIDMVESLKSVE